MRFRNVSLRRNDFLHDCLQTETDMGAAAAIILRRERDIVQVYRGAGATDARTARTPDDLGVERRLPFGMLVRHAVLRDAGDGRYYLDEPSWEALRRMRHRLVVIMLLIVAVLFAAGAFGVRIFKAGRAA
jgi:hypothetical protein